MKIRSVVSFLIMLAVCSGLPATISRLCAAEEGNLPEIQSVTVDGRSLQLQPGRELTLGAFPKNIVFEFGQNSPQGGALSRLQHKLDGYDKAWQTGGGFMFVMIRYYTESGDLVSQKYFKVQGDSTGWSSTLDGSPLTHRRETLTVPPKAARLWVVISSAGPPSTMGVYVVSDLTVLKISAANRKPEVLLRSPFDEGSEEVPGDQAPKGWERDGTRPSMANIVEVGRDPKTKAFAIVDDDPLGHAEWHNQREFAPRVSPNDSLVVEWNEMFSIGESHQPSHNLSSGYPNLPPGMYQFRVAEMTVFGRPAGPEAMLAIRVLRPYWEMPWFWVVVAAITVAASTTGARYHAWQKMQRTMSRLEQQRALEQERLRIAQDIHDDLGARVTQISMLSGMAQNDSRFPEIARAEFDRISLMARDLVAALYETVWAVNPENDNLDALGNYLGERLNELCAQAHLRCRFHMAQLPRHIVISSRIRHNMSMAVKEAAHNVIKHAEASEVTAYITFVDKLLTVSIQDDGAGFRPADAPVGNGLINMKRRLECIGGNCAIESQPGKGTTVHLRMVIESSIKDCQGKPAPGNSTTPAETSQRKS